MHFQFSLLVIAMAACGGQNQSHATNGALCQWAQTSPIVWSGTDAGNGLADGDSCSIGSSTGQIFELRLDSPPSRTELVFAIDYTKISPGTFSLPADGFTLQYLPYGDDCGLTGGSVMWTAPPWWQLSIDGKATCSDGSGVWTVTMDIVGTYSGPQAN
jgi:hypothetical protein